MIEVNNLTRSPRSRVDEALLRKVARVVLKGEGKEEIDFSVALVGAKRAAELNKKYRKKDKVANVLAFMIGVEGCLGEVVLCPSQIKKDAKKYGMIFEQALAWMFIHGMLHVLGYDHKRKKDTERMEEREQFYVKLVN